MTFITHCVITSPVQGFILQIEGEIKMFALIAALAIGCSTQTGSLCQTQFQGQEDEPTNSAVLACIYGYDGNTSTCDSFETEFDKTACEFGVNLKVEQEKVVTSANTTFTVRDWKEQY